MPIGGGVNYGALDNTDATTPVCRAGTLRYDRQSGNTYVYLQASAAITVGQVLTPFHQGDGPGVAINGTLTTTIAAGDSQITGTDLFAVTDDGMIGSTAVGVENGHILRFHFDGNAVGAGQNGIITRRVTDSVVDVYVESQGTAISSDGTLAVGSASQTFIATTNTRVEATGLASDRAIAVAQFAVPDERWFWGLHNGTGLAKLDADGDAPVATTGMLVPAAAGMCVGEAGTLTALNVASSFGYAYLDQASTDDDLISINVHCNHLWPNPGGHGSPNRRGISYPGWWKQ